MVKSVFSEITAIFFPVCDRPLYRDVPAVREVVFRGYRCSVRESGHSVIDKLQQVLVTNGHLTALSLTKLGVIVHEGSVAIHNAVFCEHLEKFLAHQERKGLNWIFQTFKLSCVNSMDGLVGSHVHKKDAHFLRVVFHWPLDRQIGFEDQLMQIFVSISLANGTQVFYLDNLGRSLIVDQELKFDFFTQKPVQILSGNANLVGRELTTYRYDLKKRKFSRLLVKLAISRNEDFLLYTC